MRSLFYTVFLTIAISVAPCHLSYVKAQLLQYKTHFTRGDSLRGSLTPMRTAYDIQYYHLEVTLDIEKRFISGSNLFRFKAIEDINRLQFDLFNNLHIEKIVYHGQELSFEREYNAVFVEFPKGIKKGTTDSFVV